jgi:regulator of extracellular matrix RemA (YlzA/DUF370 family)
VEIVDRLAQAIADESVEVERVSKDERSASELLDALGREWRAGVEDVRAGL